MNQRHILLLDPKAGSRRNLAFLLHLAGYLVSEASATDEALNRLGLCGETPPIDLLLACEGDPALDLPGLLFQLRSRHQSVLILTGQQPPRLVIPSPWVSCHRLDVIETLARRYWTTDFFPLSLGHCAEIPDEALT